MSCCVTISLAGVSRGRGRLRRSIDPPSYGHGGRSARSYDFEDDTMGQGDYIRNTRQAAGTNYGAPGGGAQPTYSGPGGGGGGGGGIGGNRGVPGAGGGEPLMPYRYGYAVQDDIGNDFNQQEQSEAKGKGGDVEWSHNLIVSLKKNNFFH